MIEELHTSDFVLYTQKFREAKDLYTARKVQKDRIKAKKWINLFLEDREIILTFKDGLDVKTVVATLKNDNPNRLLLPEIIPTKEIINGQEVFEEQHIVFYTVPDYTPMIIHVDQIINFYVNNRNIMEVSVKLNTQGKRYVREVVEE